MSQYIVTVTVSFLFAWALALAGSTLWLRLWSRRQQKLRLASKQRGSHRYSALRLTRRRWQRCVAASDRSF